MRFPATLAIVTAGLGGCGPIIGASGPESTESTGSSGDEAASTATTSAGTLGSSTTTTGTGDDAPPLESGVDDAGSASTGGVAESTGAGDEGTTGAGSDAGGSEASTSGDPITCDGQVPPFCSDPCMFDPFTSACVPPDGGTTGPVMCDGLDLLSCLTTPGCTYDALSSSCEPV